MCGCRICEGGVDIYVVGECVECEGGCGYMCACGICGCVWGEWVCVGGCRLGMGCVEPIPHPHPPMMLLALAGRVPWWCTALAKFWEVHFAAWSRARPSQLHWVGLPTAYRAHPESCAIEGKENPCTVEQVAWPHSLQPHAAPRTHLGMGLSMSGSITQSWKLHMVAESR